MKPYLAFRKWVDRDLSRGQRVILGSDGKSTLRGSYGRPGLCYLLAIMPFLVVTTLEGLAADGLSRAGVVVSVLLSGPLLGFVGWRHIRILKASAIKSGRYYERKARFALPPEYGDAEDAILAKKRRSN